MTRLVIAALFVLLGTTFQSTGADDENAALNSRPNILLMMADDLGWDDVCANQALNGRQRCNIYTPALDALAASGTRLMRHYTEPWCLPSRSSLLTGIAPARLGVNFVNMEAHETRLLFGHGPSSSRQGEEGRGSREDAAVSAAALKGEEGVTGAGAQYVGLATHLRAAGYTTAWVGKWHSVGLPHSMGFQQRFGSLFGQLKDYYKPSLVRYPPLEGPGGMNGTREVVQGYATQREAEEAVAIIQSRDWSPEHPFFLYLAWHAPHSPHQRTEEAKRYEHFYSRERSYRMGQITALDRGVGAVMRALKRKNFIESTLVVFLSDNGAPGPSNKKTSPSSLRAFGEGSDFINDHTKRPYPSNYPLLGFKGSLYEGGIRTFAVASWPRHISPSSFSRAPTHISDWLPTFLHLALRPTVASEATSQLDGKPVWQILVGACDRAYDHLSSVASYENNGRTGSSASNPDFRNLVENQNTSSKSRRRGGGVYDLGCRGAPISISSHLPMFGNGRHKLDLARKQDWARIGSATAVHGTNAALMTSYSLTAIYRDTLRSGSQGPQLPPMYYFARGAYFSLDGTCKVFLDPDASSDSHGANVHTGRPAPSHCITGTNQPVEAVEFKRVVLVEPELPLAPSAVAPSPFAVPLEVPWSSYGGNERHCAWDSMQQEWQELVQAQEPDYGGRLARAPAWNKTSNTSPVCPLR